MVDFLVATKGLTKHQAYQLTSIAGNVAITQLVDEPNLGVHVKMPKSIFKSQVTGPVVEILLRRARARGSRAPHGDGARVALAVEGGAMRGVSRPAWCRRSKRSA